MSSNSDGSSHTSIRYVTGREFITFARRIQEELKVDVDTEDPFWMDSDFWTRAIKATQTRQDGVSRTLTGFGRMSADDDNEVVATFDLLGSRERKPRVKAFFRAVAQMLNTKPLTVTDKMGDPSKQTLILGEVVPATVTVPTIDTVPLTGCRSVIAVTVLPMDNVPDTRHISDMIYRIDERFERLDNSEPPVLARIIGPDERLVDVLVRLVDRAVKEATTSPGGVLIGVDVKKYVDFDVLSQKHGVPNVYPNDLRRMADIDYLQWYAGVPMRSVAGVLVSNSVHQLVNHHLSMEPAGELPSFRESEEREVVFRVWRRLLDGRTEQTVIERNAHYWEKPLFDVDQDHVVRVIRVADDVEGQLAARWALHEFKSQLITCGPIAPKPLVLHWQCTMWRKHDLLSPISESLRWEIGLNRRTHFYRTESTPLPISDQERIRRWIEKRVRREHHLVVMRCLEGLLLGGGRDRDFSDLAQHLITMFHAIRLPVRIVVENSHHADELVKRILDELNSPIEGHQLFVACTELADQVPDNTTLNYSVIAHSPALEELGLSADAMCLARIAAMLGWDVPLSWMRNVWTYPRFVGARKRLCGFGKLAG